MKLASQHILKTVKTEKGVIMGFAAFWQDVSTTSLKSGPACFGTTPDIFHLRCGTKDLFKWLIQMKIGEA